MLYLCEGTVQGGFAERIERKVEKSLKPEGIWTRDVFIKRQVFCTSTAAQKGLS